MHYHRHEGWWQPLPEREPVHGLPVFRYERPRDPGKEPRGMVQHSGDNSGLDTLYHWTQYVHYEHADNDYDYDDDDDDDDDDE